ncbi:MAG: hypothetical protein ABT01_02470 [Clostridium sp. SCN 57-10]|nr:MAG: hypothetical protein ABT01_02470 [Clostridium sp. SCN 57-10]
MKEHGMSRTSLLLLELAAAVVLFVLCAAVCIGISLRSEGISRESVELTQAVAMATEYAERWRAQPFDDLVEDSGGLRVMVRNTMRGSTRTARISVCAAKKEVYHLLVAEVRYGK